MTLVPGLPPDDPRLVAAYREADLFVLPSLHEPFGIVVLEAWAAGVPVLAAKVGGLRKLVQDGYTGLHFQPEMPTTLMSAYERITAEPGLREAMVRWASQEVEGYAWPVIGREIARLYEGLCHG